MNENLLRRRPDVDPTLYENGEVPDYALEERREYDEAISTIEKAREKHPNTRVFTAEGDGYAVKIRQYGTYSRFIHRKAQAGDLKGSVVVYLPDGRRIHDGHRWNPINLDSLDSGHHDVLDRKLYAATKGEYDRGLVGGLQSVGTEVVRPAQHSRPRINSFSMKLPDRLKDKPNNLGL